MSFIELLLKAQTRNRIDFTPVIEVIKTQGAQETTDYSTGAHKADALNKEKLKQRIELASHAPKNSIIVELFAGKANLSNAVYEKIAKKIYAVEKNKKTFEELQQNKTAKFETYNTDNLNFISTKIPQIPKIDLVDFDAFGSIVKQVNLFFENYKIKNTLLIGVTDGFGSNIQRIYRDNDRLQNELLRCGYPTQERNGLSVNMFMIKIVDRFMELVAKKYKYKFEKIKSSHNRKFTVYGGYRFSA